MQFVTHDKCREIVAELKSGVPVSDAPYASALLVRTLQEMTAELYVMNVMKQKPKDKSANIDASANHLLGNTHSTDPVDRLSIATSFKTSRNEYAQLCEAAHNLNFSLSPEHVRKTWASLKGGMDLLWKRIHAAEESDSNSIEAEF